jgi:hypothetical protein
VDWALKLSFETLARVLSGGDDGAAVSPATRHWTNIMGPT